MKELVMDAASWKTVDDLFSSFMEVVGAPSWHGKNLDALCDSIRRGGINKIEVPYQLVFKNYTKVHPAVKAKADSFAQVIRELANEGVPVGIQIRALD
jgi:RNAse (barnase) inhibitor barstar